MRPSLSVLHGPSGLQLLSGIGRVARLLGLPVASVHDARDVRFEKRGVSPCLGGQRIRCWAGRKGCTWTTFHWHHGTSRLKREFMMIWLAAWHHSIVGAKRWHRHYDAQSGFLTTSTTCSESASNQSLWASLLMVPPNVAGAHLRCHGHVRPAPR